MKELKIRITKEKCKKIYEIIEERNIDDNRLKEIILSHIRSELKDIFFPDIKSIEELDKIKLELQNIRESPNNWKYRVNWINDYGVFFKIIIPVKMYKPQKYSLDVEIEEIKESN